jgi:non-homologous end joining protein Ku
MGSQLGRAAEANVNVRFGLMSMQVNLYTGESNEGKKAVRMRNCCPTCYKGDQVVPLGVRMYCEFEHGPFGNDEVLKGSEGEDGVLSIVGNAEEVREQKSSVLGLEKKEMELEFLSAEDVRNNFFPADKVWIVQPTKASPFFTALLQLMDGDGVIDAGDDRIGIATIRIRDAEHVVMLSRWEEQMVIVKLLRPEDCKVLPAPLEVEVSGKNLTMIRTLIGAETVEFSRERFTDQARERLVAWKQARSSGVTVDVPKKAATVKDPDAELSAMLEAALEAAKAKSA